MDEDAHMHVYDVSTDAKLENVIFAILQTHLEGNYIRGEDAKRAKEAIKEKDVDSAIDLIDDSDGVGFERSRGGRMYIVDVKSNWDQKAGY